LPEFFPKIFGPNENEELDLNATKIAFEGITNKINEYNRMMGSREISIYESALGFIKVANETMSRPIRSLTQGRGFNPKNHILDIFGGAGA
jgi:5-oxoprolinase (ATP-hydrolysing)